MATHSSVLALRIPGTGGAWWAAVYGVAQSRTRLKRLSSSSSRRHHFVKKDFFHLLDNSLLFFSVPALFQQLLPPLSIIPPARSDFSAVTLSILFGQNNHLFAGYVLCTVQC